MSVAENIDKKIVPRETLAFEITTRFSPAVEVYLLNLTTWLLKRFDRLTV